MKLKKCYSCKVEKPLTAEYFHRKSASATGFLNCCKECEAERMKEYYQKNKEHQKEYYQKNKEDI